MDVSKTKSAISSALDGDMKHKEQLSDKSRELKKVSKNITVISLSSI